MADSDANCKRRHVSDVQLLAAITYRTHNVVVVTDVDARVTWVNEAFTRVTGYSFDEVDGRTMGSVVHGTETDATVVQSMREAIAKGEGFHAEVLNYGKSGQPYWLEIVCQPFFDTNGALQGFFAVEEEITARKRIEEQLRDSEARLRALVEALPDMVFRISRDWKFLDVHTPQEDMLLLPSCEFLGRCVNEVMPPELSVPLYETTERVRREKIPQIYEYQLEVKGGLRDYEARIVPGHGTDILVVVRDVSESKLLDKMKNEFVSTISHELRTPLTAIRGTLGLLAAGVLGTLETEAQSLVEAALHNSERLGRLINDILELDRVSHRGFELTVSAQSLAPLIERAIIESAVFAAEYQVTYSVSELVRTARASIDTDRFLQVMSNLLSNAAKYGDSCEVVTVGLERSGTSWRVYVRNRGAPIPPSFRRRIFSRFAVVDGTDMRSHQGTGLGLAISKVLMERMGGRIDYQSTSAFTEFFLEFPVVIDD